MGELDVVHGKRKESAAKYKEAQDVYWSKVQEFVSSLAPSSTPSHG